VNGQFDLGRSIILLGLLLVGLGFVISVLGRLGFGRLPGDITVQKPGFTFYFPLASCVLLSLLLTLAFWLLRRR
jgi:membrane protein implicated in regulation of membrane protease activity